MRLEVVRGRLADAVAEEVLSFWSRHGAIEGEAARQRLAELVCLLRNESGEVVGVNSVFDAPVALIGNRRFWVYRRFLAHGLPEDADAMMFNAAFVALTAEFAPGGPVGLCLFVDDLELMRRRREAVWPETKLAYAGYTDDRRQVRIRYFDDAEVA